MSKVTVTKVTGHSAQSCLCSPSWHQWRSVGTTVQSQMQSQELGSIVQLGGGVAGGLQMYCSERTLKTYPALRKVEDYTTLSHAGAGHVCPSSRHFHVFAVRTLEICGSLILTKLRSR